MKANLKNLRKVFITQIQTGVKTQQKYLSMKRSQESLNNSETIDQASGLESEEEDSFRMNMSVSQEFQKFEAEK